MKFTEAIASLIELDIENKEEILEAINRRLQETETLETTNQNLQTNLDNILDLAGVTEGNLTQKLEKAQQAIQGLKDTETNYQTQLADKDRTIAQMQREGTISNISRLTKANPHVLKTLLNNQEADLSIKDDKAYIKVGEGEPIELTEYANSNWKDFTPSLFPGSNSTDPTVTLPGGSSSGQQPKTPDAIDTFMNDKFKDLKLFEESANVA